MNEVIKRKIQKLQMKKFLCIVFLLCSGILSAQTYKVGDLYVAPDGSKGIVYYVFPGGTGGWVVALKDASTGCGWGVAEDVQALPNQNSTYVQNLLADTAGYANTLAMRNHPNNNTYYAAARVNFANGWVLPSPGQLSILFGQLPFISNAIINAGGTALATNDYYWSSAEYSATNAWRIYFGTGSFNNGTKSVNSRVRAVRSFTMTSATNNTEYSYSWSTGATTEVITENPTQTTSYTVTVSSSDGSSGEVSKTIVVNTEYANEFSVDTSDFYAWNGIIYRHSGDYTQSFNSVAGCDSMVTLHLTLNTSLDVSITSTSDTICNGNNVTLSASAGNAQLLPLVAVGDILCTDGSIEKPVDWPVAGKTAMGVVFYVDVTGEHGWAVHLQTQSAGMQWGGFGVDIEPLADITTIYDALRDIDGYANTQKIRNAGNAITYPAAYAVDFANDWYLPAAGQLRVLYSSMIVVNKSLQKVNGVQFSTTLDWDYWSSTEYDGTTAWFVGQNGTVFGFGKEGTYEKVVSVRNF